MEYYEEEPSEIHHYVDPDPFEYELMNSNCLRLHPKGDKLKNSINTALQHFDRGKPIILSGEGYDTSQTVRCAEIIKSKTNDVVHQNTQICQMRTVETWRSLLEGLDDLQVVRSVPIIHILLSLEPLEDSMDGYQQFTNEQREEPHPTMFESSISTPSSPPAQVPQSPRSPTISINLSSSL